MHIGVIIFGLSVLCHLIDASENETNKSRSIIIVGAGLSGFQAAANLIENGFENVVLLEAENRIGGRIHSVPYGDEGGKIDLGGQWVHGEKNNAIYETAHEFYQFGSSRFDEIPRTFLFSNGTMPNQESCVQLVKLAYSVLENYKEMANFEGSLGEYFLSIFDAILSTTEFQNVDPQLISGVKELIHRETNGYFASESWFEISAKLTSQTEETEGNQHLTWKKDGFIKFFDFITKKAFGNSHYLDIESKIQFNKKVKNIAYNLLSSEKVTVECVDGSTFYADHVIFTGSIGVLKKYHTSLFTPNLPQEKISAIENIGFGSVGKIFLEFDEPFWPVEEDSFRAYSFLWNDEDENEIKATNREWLFGITGFMKVDQYPNLLEGFLSGERIEIFENLTDEKCMDDVMWFLEKLMQKSLPKPTLMMRTKWLTNENFLGAYSYTSMQAEKFNVDPRVLVKSIKNTENTPIILFAGEATDFEFQSYSNGAVISGKRAAQEIINHY